MANEEHLRLLRQGIDAWNTWRLKNLTIRPDFSGASLANLNLWRVFIPGSPMRGVLFYGAELRGADFSKADLSFADLEAADLRGAKLTDARLFGANLSYANLIGAQLDGASLHQAILNGTYLVRSDLSAAKGLDQVHHRGPSSIDLDVIFNGNVPETFLRGCGVSDTMITFSRSLIGRAIEYYSCFISYSTQDQGFAERLYTDLQTNGVRCWFAPHDLKIGDRFRQRIDEAIRVHDKVLLILSGHSVESDWVTTEVETAFEKERQRAQTVLFPVRIDDLVMRTDQAWAADIRRTRHIGDFGRWKEHTAYTAAFDRLLRDLKVAKA